MSADVSLAAADAYCRYLAGRHYENFSVASAALPGEIRRHLARIYAYCRTTDDLGDESGGAGESRLRSWEDQVRQLFGAGAAPIHPVLLALQRTIDECALPAAPFFDLIGANLQDQQVEAYESWEDLHAYCLLSAAPVGRLVLRVFGVHSRVTEALSDDVCIGLQLANFAQDVSVDREKGRIYLIQSDIRRYGAEGAVKAMCTRAEGLLESGKQLETLVPYRLRMQLALYRLGGMAVMAAIRRDGYRTQYRRPHVEKLEKAALVSVALLQSGRRKRYVPAGRAI